MQRTLAVFHAHPDDESVLTAGVMARAAAEGNRVVFVLATDGSLGRADGRPEENRELGSRRLVEAESSARILGVTRFAYLGYADSGSDPTTRIATTTRESFVSASIDDAAARLADVLTEERADILVSDDRNGGYGHPDHIRAHRVARRAGAMAGTPRFLQATVPREILGWGTRLGRVLRLPVGLDTASMEHAYSSRAEITHRVRVRGFLAQKRASLRAHASQTGSDGADRVLAGCLRLPRPVQGLLFGWEWFVQDEHEGPLCHDVLAEPRASRSRSWR